MRLFDYKKSHESIADMKKKIFCCAHNFYFKYFKRYLEYSVCLTSLCGQSVDISDQIYFTRGQVFGLKIDFRASVYRLGGSSSKTSFPAV